MVRPFLAAALVAAAPSLASAQIRITEWLYSGAPGEFVELTNVGAAPVDMAGYKYDDDSADPSPGVSFSLSGFGVVQPGESVVFTEATTTTFALVWNLPASVKLLGGYTNNLGRTDQINIFDASNALVDRLTYSDVNFPGTIRTLDISGNVPPSALGLNTVAAATLSSVGDAYGSAANTSGVVGNPGRYAVPEPAALAALAGAGMVLVARKRK